MKKIKKMRGNKLEKGLIDLTVYLSAKLNHKINMVEIGSFTGESAILFYENLNCNLACVDMWEMGYDDNDWASKTNMQAVEQCFDDTVKDTSITKHKMSSVEASKLYEDGSLDFVYIDANHTYEGVKEDIEVWMPKIKPTGYIGGHDYGPKRWGGKKSG